MCGIGGFVDYERDARRGGPILHGMKRTLTPRGPDAEGTYFDEDAALVHRRLIVIDPEGGKQPMHSPDRNTIIIYNGELYNTPELRTELMSRGHEFVGHSDTEVLLHAYLEWKTDAFARLNGIFAFAIWEKRERRLTLCRDRLGVKPLFFAPIRNGLTFGSTIDTVLCHPEIEPALDEDGLRTLLLLGPARPPESGVFRQIKSLLPGHFAVLTPENFTDHTYWQLEAHEHEDDLPTTIERTHELICDAARRQLVSDVPLACFLSGGLDSTLALIVLAHAFDMLELDRKGILAVTMPCFGTTDRTYHNALDLMTSLGVSQREIPIHKAVRQHFADIGHDESDHSVTYENCQARERTQVLMDVANKIGAIVLGTGDLSEIALGWCTYNADHMSMYGVNSGVPKTLVRWVIQTAAENEAFSSSRECLQSILDTPISPELLPPDEKGNILQQTEDVVGPYALHDFFLYYAIRFGYPPKKVFDLCCIAFQDDFSCETILKWLKNFYRRFWTQQFKRNCMPDGVKIGSIALSPRGDWRMPSDAQYKAWMDECDCIKA